MGSVTQDRGEEPRSPGAPPDTREEESLGGLIHCLFPGEGRVQMTATGSREPLSLEPPNILSSAWEGLVTGHLAPALPGFVPRLSSLRAQSSSNRILHRPYGSPLELF